MRREQDALLPSGANTLIPSPAKYENRRHSYLAGGAEAVSSPVMSRPKQGPFSPYAMCFARGPGTLDEVTSSKNRRSSAKRSPSGCGSARDYSRSEARVPGVYGQGTVADEKANPSVPQRNCAEPQALCYSPFLVAVRHTAVSLDQHRSPLPSTNAPTNTALNKKTIRNFSTGPGDDSEDLST